MRNLLPPFNKADLVQSFNVRRKATVNTENLALDNSSDAKKVEHFCAVLPGVGVTVLAHGLIIEAINLGDLASLVVASQKSDVSWILQLQAQKQLECLNRIKSAVDKIAHKDVPRVWDVTSLVEKLEEIMELTMDITANGNWSADWLNITLFNK